MIARQLLLSVLSTTLAVAPLPAQASSYNDNTATVRLSFMFGHGSKPSEPWLGLNFSQRSKIAPWEMEAKETPESSISLNLAAPEIAFVNQGNRTVLSLGEEQDQLSVGCGPPSNKDINVVPTVAGIVIVSVAAYMLISDQAVIKKGC